MAPTNKATLQTRCPYIQGTPTDKGALHTRGPHIQGVHTVASTAKDPYRRCVIPTDKELSQTIRGSYRQLGDFTDN